MQENNVKLRLNIVDTPGYGDLVNNENWCVPPLPTSLWRATNLAHSWDPIIKYIKDQHSAYLRKELTAMRDKYIVDTRIHCCLYFIAPTGHSLKAIDITVMKKLSEVVNVVPVIAKSDSLTLDEREAFKLRVRPLRACSPGRELIPLPSVDPRRACAPQHSRLPFRQRGERRGGDAVERGDPGAFSLSLSSRSH